MKTRDQQPKWSTMKYFWQALAIFYFIYCGAMILVDSGPDAVTFVALAIFFFIGGCVQYLLWGRSVPLGLPQTEAVDGPYVNCESEIEPETGIRAGQPPAKLAESITSAATRQRSAFNQGAPHASHGIRPARRP